MTTTATNSLYTSGTSGAALAHTTQPADVTVSTPGAALTQVSSVLGAILLLILFLGWLVKRLGLTPQAPRHNKLLKVSASCQLGRNERVVVVEVDNKWLVLGVTAQQVTHLQTLDAKPEQLESSSETSATKSVDFAQLLQRVLKRPGK